MNNNYNFPVKLEPITTSTGIEISKRLAVIREDTGTPLGIVSDKYKLLRHEEVVDTFRDALNDTTYEEKIQMVKNGGQLFLTYKLGNIEIEVKKGDVVGLQFVVKNSYDGTNALQIMLGAFRLVCTNGMVIGRRFFAYSQRHMGTRREIAIDFIKARVGMLTQQFRKTLPFLQEMSRFEISETSNTLFDRKRVNLPQYLLNVSENNYNLGNDPTAWGYYNAMTAAITHNLKRESPQNSIGYGKTAWEVVQNTIKSNHESQ